ncbi:MAG: hypothetical protein HYY06_32520 [Deltaproteobacteria bacterium]|nr:hypothetical protein [Deltaproteobacteria bacterium]
MPESAPVRGRLRDLEMAEPTETTTTPDPAPPPQAPFGVKELTERLEREIEATTDRARKSQLLYELGELFEWGASDEARAVKSYVAAVNADPASRPPLWNLFRIFTARSSFKNLAKIVDAEVRASPEGRERAEALVVRAELAEDRLGDAAGARETYERARAEDPRCQAALMALERHFASEGDLAKLAQVIEAFSAARAHPVLRALAAIELAEIQDGLDGSDPEKTAALWLRARESGALRWRALRGAERFAARADRPEELAEILEAQAEIALRVARGEPGDDDSVDPLPFWGPDRPIRAAVALLRRAARIREVVCKDARAALGIIERAVQIAPGETSLASDRLRLVSKTGDGARVAECIDAAMTGAPEAERVSLLVRAAQISRLEGDAARERAYLSRALEIEPGSAVAEALLEASLLSQRDADGLVQRLCGSAETASDTRDRGRLLLAAADVAVGWSRDLGKAEGLLAKAQEAAPDPSVLRARATVQAGREAWPELGVTLQKLLETSDSRVERLSVARDLAFLRAVQLHDPAGAAEACEGALAVDPACRWALWMLADLGGQTGDHARRAAAHERLAELAGSDDEKVSQLVCAAHARSLAGDQPRAREDLERANERRPGDLLLEAMIGEKLRALDATRELVAGERRRAEAIIAKGADDADDRAKRILGRAAILAGTDHGTRAEIYERIVGLDADDAGGWHGLVRSLEALGDPGRLLQALEKRAERLSGPARATALVQIAEIHEVAGRADLALQAYGEALESDAALVDALPGRIATVGASGDRAELGRVLNAARATASKSFARALDEELLVLDGLDRGGAAERLAAGDDACALGLLFAAWRAGVRGDVSARLSALARFVDATKGSDLHAPALGALTCAARAASSDDVLQSSARALAACRPEARALGVVVADGLGPGLDESLRAAALEARLAIASPARRTGLEVERAEALEGAGRDGDALAIYRGILEILPDDLAALEGVRRTARRLGAFDVLADASQAEAKLVVEPLGAAPMWEEAGLVAQDHLDDRRRAEACYRAALEADAGRDAAYHRLHEILVSRGAKRELAGWVRRRSEVVMEPEELSGLFREHAELLRTLGDREGALGALENLLLLGDQDVPALEMRASLLCELKRIAEAVDALGELSDAHTDVSEKRAARARAAELLEKNQHDWEGAVGQLWKLDESGFADLDTYERLAAIASRGGLDGHLLRAHAKLAAARPDATGKAEAERCAAETLRKMGDLPGSAEALARLLVLVPDDMPALETLCEISADPGMRAAALAEAERKLRERFEADPLDVPTLHALAQVFALGGQRDARFLACSVLSAFGVASAAEAHDAARMREQLPRRPAAALSEATLERIGHPDDRGAARALFHTIAEALPEHYGLEPSAFGVGRSERVSPKGVSALRDEVAIWTGALSLGAIELYQGGHEPNGVVPLPGQPAVLILGARLEPPLGAPALFALGRAAMRLRRGTAALHGREPDEIGALLYAAVRTVAPQVPAPPLLRLAEFTESLPRALSRKVKKALPEPAQAFASGPDHAEWALAERHTANRAGALYSRDPAAALALVIGATPDPAAVRRSPEGVELVRFVLSPAFLALRREAGLGIG